MKNEESTRADVEKKVYEMPKLTDHGPVEELTLTSGAFNANSDGGSGFNSYAS